MGYINWQDENKTVPPRELRLTYLGVAGAAMAEQIIAEVVKERDAAIARAEAAEAELEALKAATEWHETGQEVPPVAGLYQVYTGADFNHWYFDNEKWEPDIEVESESWPELWRHITELPAPPQE